MLHFMPTLRFPTLFARLGSGKGSILTSTTAGVVLSGGTGSNASSALCRMALTFCLAVAVINPAHAAPNSDDMDRLLEDKGLLTRIEQQIEQVRQTATQTASELVVTALGFLGEIGRASCRERVLMPV